MEQNLSILMDRTLRLGVEVVAHKKVHFLFCAMFLQSHQEILYFEEIFQNVHSKFHGVLHHL